MKHLTFILCLVFSISSWAAEDWTLAKSSQGVDVYTKEIQVDIDGKQSTLLAYKGQATVSGNLSDYIAIMRDVKNFDKWLHNTYEPELVELTDTETRLVYQKISTPWPTSDRDVLLNQKLIFDDHYLRLDMVNTENPLRPLNEDFVRIPFFQGYWSVSETNDGLLNIIYEASYDSGGSVPQVITNMLLVDVPFNSVRNLIEYANN